MELYYSPGAGALASHITIRELNLDVDVIGVDVQKTHQTETGEDYYAINPKGYVPFLTIDDDSSLSEGAAILQYLADQDPEGRMIPPVGTLERYRAQEWLTFVGTEPQRILGSFFIDGHLTDAGLEFGKSKLHQRLAIMDNRLADNEYLLGAEYSVADAYAFAILNWIPAFGLEINLSEYKNLTPYLDKIRNRDAVQTAMKEEGLLQ
ncbi:MULTISPECIES: glutathione binding-like protein [Falsihalocynthiibacter]|uniref:glutathione binding-like protein n=1 Tax=Falsihalocynthiibacter TaxID=2854182 RepID=UPI0030034E40